MTRATGGEWAPKEVTTHIDCTESIYADIETVDGEVPHFKTLNDPIAVEELE